MANSQSKPIRIGLVAGEASGDILAAGLMKELQKKYPDAVFEGIGGERMRQQGMHSFFPMERLSVMGLIEPLKRIFELIKPDLAYFGLKDALISSNSDPANKEAHLVLQTLEKVDMSLLQGEAHMHWMDLLYNMITVLESIKTSADLEAQRQAFIQLSEDITASVKTFLMHITLFITGIAPTDNICEVSTRMLFCSLHNSYNNWQGMAYLRVNIQCIHAW